MVSRPVSGPARVSGDTASHAEYGVGPATDYAVGSGTPVRAPFTGNVSWSWSTTGGNTVAVDQGDTQFYGQHLSTPYRDGFSGRATETQQIALSGNSGTATTGPHLHCWVVVLGTRMSMEEYIAYAGGTPVALNDYTPSGTSSAGSNPTPFEEDDMYTDGDRYRDNLILAALIGQDAAGKKVNLDPNVNFGQPIRESIFEARKGIQALINAGAAVIDPDKLANAIVAKLPKGTLTKADVAAAISEAKIPTAEQNGAAARAAIVK